MFRLRAASAALRELFPPGLAPVYEAVTTLGDAEVLVAVLAVCYWVGPRRETLRVVVYGFVGLAAVVGLKALFGLPRPPASVALVAAEGYGFPSGHAVAAAVVYGGAALEFGWLRDRRRALAAAALVLAVALSRVVLGVHYLGDVLAGLAVGVAVVALVHTVAPDVRRGFALAGAVALAALAVAGPTSDVLVAVGGSAGGLLASGAVDAVPAEPQSWGEAGVLVAGGGVTVAGLRTAREALAATPLDVGVLAVNAALVAAVVLLPAVTAGVGFDDGDERGWPLRRR